METNLLPVKIMNIYQLIDFASGELQRYAWAYNGPEDCLNVSLKAAIIFIYLFVTVGVEI